MNLSTFETPQHSHTVNKHTERAAAAAVTVNPTKQREKTVLSKYIHSSWRYSHPRTPAQTQVEGESERAKYHVSRR
jgi:hypothetical protein